MIISHEHKFIFLKTHKTAGTSIEMALSQFCGEGDVLTPFTPEDEAARPALGYRSAQNYRFPFRDYDTRMWARLARGRGRAGFQEHVGAAEVRTHVGEPIWSSYFKFAVERNPWDRIISWYFWLMHERPEPWPSISEWLRTARIYVPGFDTYAIGGRVAVDAVLRYEDLPAELDRTVQHLGLGDSITLPRAKSHVRLDRRPYAEVLSEEDRGLVAVAYAREIAVMGYKF